tara:strand:- start:424 stop:1296 length:873 start_codon:yes stop_codon:yes gene_type:complete
VARVITHTFNLKDLTIYHASPVRRNDEGKTVIQQCHVELQNKKDSFLIVRREVLKQLLDYCYESCRQESLSKSEFNFMYRNCIEHKPSSFSLKAIIHDAIYDADDVEITFVVGDNDSVLEIPKKKPLQLDDMFYTTCRDTLSSVIYLRENDRPKVFLMNSKATKEMRNLKRGKALCSIFTTNLNTLYDFHNLIFLEITQLPKYYTIAVKVRCGSGYVQPVPAHTNDGLVCMENNDVLHGVLKQILENLDDEITSGNLSKTKGKKAWNKYNPNLWFSDKNKLERENYLFFL